MALRRHGGRPLHTTTTAAVAAAGAALSCPSPSLLLPLPLSTKAGAARDASATTSALYTRTFVHGGRRLFHSTPVSQQQQQQQQQRDGIPAAAAGTLLDIPLASLGSGVRQALVGHWRVQPGDLVRRGEVMVELSSATADFGLQAPCDARVVELHVEEGEMAIVGAPIIRLMLVEDARAAMPATSAATSSYAASSSAATSAAVGAGASGRASMTASSGGQMDPVDAAAHVLRLQRLLKRARRERRPADQIYALLVAIMRTNNEQGWFARTRAFYDTEVEQSEAHGEPMSKEYWRAEDALQAQRGTPAAMQQQQQQQQQLQQQQQVQQQPPPTPAPAPETASSKLIFTPPASSVYASDNSSSYAPSSPALYVRRVLPSYPHMYVPIFSVRRLFAREDASKQSYYVWLMVLTGVVAFLYHDSEFLDIHLKNASVTHSACLSTFLFWLHPSMHACISDFLATTRLTIAHCYFAVFCAILFAFVSFRCCLFSCVVSRTQYGLHEGHEREIGQDVRPRPRSFHALHGRVGVRRSQTRDERDR
jgi:biotin carboxyl carrier protein